jgi:hypothetical protein
VQNMTANKLFNYYLQATETEVSVQKLQAIQTILQDRETCIILYTYDSILLDVPKAEAKDVIPAIKSVIETGNFPVKIQVGNSYQSMKTINFIKK